jgi:hypothetical protein
VQAQGTRTSCLSQHLTHLSQLGERSLLRRLLLQTASLDRSQQELRLFCSFPVATVYCSTLHRSTTLSCPRRTTLPTKIHHLRTSAFSTSGTAAEYRISNISRAQTAAAIMIWIEGRPTGRSSPGCIRGNCKLSSSFVLPALLSHSVAYLLHMDRCQYRNSQTLIPCILRHGFVDV